MVSERERFTGIMNDPTKSFAARKTAAEHLRRLLGGDTLLPLAKPDTPVQ